MTNTTTQTTEQQSAGRKPTHRLYIVTGPEDKSIWTPIGAAWPNRDGKGFNISCAAIPTDGRIVMRTITPKPDAADGQGGLV